MNTVLGLIVLAAAFVSIDPSDETSSKLTLTNRYHINLTWDLT